MKTAEKSDNIG